MSIYEEELEGREFDWFAIDSEGNIGLFSTAGEGTIPNLVIEGYIEHNNISELLESPNWGSSEVWSDYAKLGFLSSTGICTEALIKESVNLQVIWTLS